MLDDTYWISQYHDQCLGVGTITMSSAVTLRGQFSMPWASIFSLENTPSWKGPPRIVEGQLPFPVHTEAQLAGAVLLLEFPYCLNSYPCSHPQFPQPLELALILSNIKYL